MSARPAPRIRRGFVNTPQGQLHYRVAGHGPPAVLIPDPPRSSRACIELLETLGEDFTVLAFDLPGYGNSTPLQGSAQPEVADFAKALGDALAALGLERTALYGFHGGSKIALELAVRQPARAGITLLEGLALPLGPPDKEFLQRFLWPFELSDDGSHLAREWTRVRDLHRFFPWFARSERARLPEELPDEKHLHGYVLDLFSAGPHYASAYAAVMRYQAQQVLPRVSSPLVVMCREDDFLYRYLDALPENLPEPVRVERLTADRDAWRDRLRELLRSASPGATPAFTLPDPLSAATGRQELRGYVNLAHGQVHLRRCGAGNKRPVLLLHETPGSSSALRPLAEELARDRQVIALDLPGLGESDPLPNPDAAAHRELLIAVLDALGLISVDVIAEFTATPLALDLARHASNRVHRLGLDGVFQITASERRALWKSYCPGMRPSWDGSHLHAVWHRLRDQELSWPWYDRSKAAVRRREPDLSPERLHLLMLDVLKQLDHYGEACLAAVDYPVKEALEEVRQPVLLLNAPEDVRYQWTRKIARRLADTETVVRATGVADRARQYAAFFDR